jgi:uncharacterized damage-inducible protein DinB
MLVFGYVRARGNEQSRYASKGRSPMKSHIVRMLRAMAWADQESLAALRDHPSSHPDALPLLAHVLGAEELWLARLESRQPACIGWPTLTIADCETLAAQNARGYQSYIEKLTDSGLTSQLGYRSAKGEEFTNSVLDILTHVVIHGAYHRGQIARIIGRAGGQTPNTDFIGYVRSLGKPEA